jgi:hypothetical protein
MNPRTLSSLNLRIIVLVGGLCLANGSGAIPLASTPAPRTPKIFEEVCYDPLAAAREGLWDIAVPVSAKKPLVFEDVKFDPLAAERSGLWQISVAAGSGVTAGRGALKK